jgi:hypothetical protein
MSRKIFALTALLATVSTVALSQPPPPPPPNTGGPLDTFTGLLLVASVAYGIYKLVKR